jgi:glycopeptide antibiotics resistance protein
MLPCSFQWDWSGLSASRRWIPSEKLSLQVLASPLFIEITRIPFYSRCTGVDDLSLNTIGIFIGALIYFSVKRLKKPEKEHQKLRTFGYGVFDVKGNYS